MNGARVSLRAGPSCPSCRRVGHPKVASCSHISLTSSPFSLKFNHILHSPLQYVIVLFYFMGPFPIPQCLIPSDAHFLLWLCLSLACCYRPSSTISQVQTRGFRVFRILPCFPPWHLPPAVILIPLAALGLQPPDL